ncbi:hypothetical protein FNJ62_15965 [Streptomyces benahoarensis]|nr:hypothetical protein [Streptomyces benahoarensis]TSB22799.1 hypothetical protein FNJ62_15965 [Streptomyces benahoarensis]
MDRTPKPLPMGTASNGWPLCRILSGMDSSKCLDVKGGLSSTPGSNLHLWDCHCLSSDPSA